MRFLPKTVRGAAAALVMVAAGCASGTPAAGPASAPQVAAIAHTGAVAASPVPPAFVASLTPAKAGRGGDRLALLSSRTGALLRWLTPQPQGASDEVLSGRDGGANNWPPGITSLTWAPDDVHLAVQFSLTAAINSVLVFDAFTAATAGAGRTAPAPCTVSDVCAEFDPAYLASGALSYVIQRVSPAASPGPAWSRGRPAGARPCSPFPPGHPRPTA